MVRFTPSPSMCLRACIIFFAVLSPQVVIDLSKDSSIYYCGIALGGGDTHGPSLASTRPEDREVPHAPCW